MFFGKIIIMQDEDQFRVGFLRYPYDVYEVLDRQLWIFKSCGGA